MELGRGHVILLGLGLSGKSCPSPHLFLGVSKPKAMRRGEGAYKIMKGHLMPETPRAFPSPSTAKCWSWVRMGFRQHTPLPRRRLTLSPPEPHYLFGIPERTADNLYDAGKATVSKVPELRHFLHLPPGAGFQHRPGDKWLLYCLIASLNI